MHEPKLKVKSEMNVNFWKSQVS